MNERTLRDNWPTPNKHLQELGRMTALWGSLESGINFAISKLAGYDVPFDDRAVIMVAHSSFQQRVDIVAALCEQLSPQFSHLLDYKAVVSKIRAAQSSRNKYAHNRIHTNEETGEVELARASARGSLKTSVEIVKVEDLIAVSATIHEAICAAVARIAPAFVLAAILLPADFFGHSGKTDSSGCHQVTETGEYHCHNKKHQSSDSSSSSGSRAGSSSYGGSYSSRGAEPQVGWLTYTAPKIEARKGSYA